MPPIEKNQKIYKSLLFLSLLALACGFLFLYFKIPSIGSIKDFFKSGKSEAVIASIKKEIINSGKLISEGQYESVVLTKSGVFNFTNSERISNGLRALTSDRDLDRVAEARMKDMFAKQYFEHVSPSGDSASKEADKIGYEYISIGENIALGSFASDRALVDAWMNSPGHRANILHGTYTVLGIAVGKGMYQGKPAWIAVQIFGKPLSACPVVDKNLKDLIDRDSATVDSYQATLEIKKAELEKMESQRGSRAEYNKAVEEYNDLVQKTNNLISEIKRNVALYNVSVNEFNACLEKSS